MYHVYKTKSFSQLESDLAIQLRKQLMCHVLFETSFGSYPKWSVYTNNKRIVIDDCDSNQYNK